jgi:DNA-binding transcriptional regulator YiaG
MLRDTIKELRGALKLTQREFSEAVGISMYTIRNWEQGKYNISGRHLAMLLNFCDKNNLIETKKSLISTNLIKEV